MSSETDKRIVQVAAMSLAAMLYSRHEWMRLGKKGQEDYLSAARRVINGLELEGYQITRQGGS